MGRSLYTAVTTLGAALIAVALIVACSGRPADYQEDFTQEVERICGNYCSMNLACREPPAFENYEECADICLGYAYIYNDTECGKGMRDMFECIGSASSCEVFNDTYDVHAADYTCKAEKDHWVSLDCGRSDEDPFPEGAP